MRFACSIFLSAFLLFQIQLILGKFLLPWFGGAPAVWTTCILFFQSFLLAGYAYAFFIDRKLSLPAQVKLHSLLLILAMASLGLAWLRWGSPVLPGDGWKPVSGSGNPIPQLLMILMAAIALSYTLLAANSPLIQRWYGIGAGTNRPYRLYALSNAGSLLALLSYPIFIEPYLPLSLQAKIWAGLYFIFIVATIASALAARKAGLSGESIKVTETIAPEAPTESEGQGHWSFWLILSACPAAMMLAITNDLSQEVAVTPFIWVLPLAIYLLSFIICFDHPRWYSRRAFVLLTYLASMVVLITNLKGFDLGMIGHVLSYGFFLFVFSMLCHGELFRIRPRVEKLTSFYLMVALGGVIGGITVGILAPTLFTGYWEFHLTVFTSWILLTYLFWKDKKSFLNTGDRWHAIALLLLTAYIITHYTLALTGGYSLPGIQAHRELANLGIALAIALALYLPFRKAAFISWPLWPRILIAMLIFVFECFTVFNVRSTGVAAQEVDRNFFGVVKINEGKIFDPYPLTIRNLVHGKILHGFQYLRGDLEMVPNSYYVRDSGVGLGILQHPRRKMGQPIRIGVTGLGAGAIAAYTEPGDLIRFYEINPLVIDHAYGPEADFTYLQKCMGTVELSLGDARLSLEKELQEGRPGKFDILVLDAFSSDSIPVHLLTREAFQMYLMHLRDEDSVIAVNISNRILDISVPVVSIARELGMEAVRIKCSGQPPVPIPSDWILMGRAILGKEPIRSAAADIRPYEEVIWTDDFSNLWKFLR
ncbi:hypothetical protein G0Q06_04010 [Puniceicoccales bacterium CK1056]|uniref:Ferrichrome ABC transporter permease n=1 Tax=Oceanipulchritudo coccoides TaxID=2706888 RepID=A0A6B2M0P6_9BACT|nr:hypothetical protein [Oceanipulchritudo coccoides]NDV61607.1 hypothetical protein [Oceanipulchritudo coccoides]